MLFYNVMYTLSSRVCTSWNIKRHQRNKTQENNHIQKWVLTINSSKIRKPEQNSCVRNLHCFFSHSFFQFFKTEKSYPSVSSKRLYCSTPPSEENSRQNVVITYSHTLNGRWFPSIWDYIKDLPTQLRTVALFGKYIKQSSYYLLSHKSLQ